MTEDRQFTVNTRDESMLTSLFFARYQTTGQLQQGHFKTEKTCSNRLHKLARMGLIEYWRPWVGHQVWRLSRSGWERETDHFRQQVRYKRKWPKAGGLEHILEISDFYVAIAPELNEEVGGYPNWEWRDEPRAYKTYPLPGNKRGYHRPDAEIHVGDLVFFLERQSARSRRTRQTFDAKCEGYKQYIEYAELDPDKAQIVFACDTERDKEYAHNAAVKYDLGHIWGGARDTTDVVLEMVKEAAPSRKLEA